MDPLIAAAATVMFSAILLLGIAFYKRGDPAWRPDMPRLGIILLGQIGLIVFLLVLSALNPD